MELSVEDPANGYVRTHIMNLADNGANSIQNFYKTEAELFSNWTNLASTGSYNGIVSIIRGTTARAAGSALTPGSL
jgi:hypothetical protein